MSEIRFRNIIIFITFTLIVVVSIDKLDGFDHAQNFFVLSTEVSSIQKEKDPLYKEISEKRLDYEREPEDAYIDRVWKKTPGRSGQMINTTASFKKMKDKGKFDESLLIYKRVEPRVTLKDLEPSPIYRGHPEKDMIALMINVSWGEEHIPKILQTLKEENVKATFFIEGKWAKENVEHLKMIKEEGHLIGNHAYNHPNMANISKQEMKKQITQTNDIIKAIIDEKPVWFAPPSGSFNQAVVEVAAAEGMETILWTVDTIDWKKPTVSVMLKRVNEKLHPGATILMHPTKPVAEGLKQMIKDAKDKGFKLNTVEALLNENW